MRESDIIAPLGLMSIMGMLAGDKKSNLLQEQIEAYQKEQEEAKNKKEQEIPVVEEDDSPELTVSNLSKYFKPGIQDDSLKETSDALSSAFNIGPELFGFNVMQSLFPQLSIADATTKGGLENLDDFIEMDGDPMGTALYLSKGTTIPGLENEIFGYNQGGLVPPLRGPMANGVGNLFKLK